MAAPHRELHRKGHPISLLWALSLVSDLSELALPSGQTGGSSDLEIGHPGYPDLLSVHFVRYLNHTILVSAISLSVSTHFARESRGWEIETESTDRMRGVHRREPRMLFLTTMLPPLYPG